jgi:hypothetical protein
VWYAIFEFGVWGSYFIEEDDVTVTVTSDRYCAMLENILLSKWMIFSMNMEQKMCSFNKMVQQPTHLVVRSEFPKKCFLGILSP